METSKPPKTRDMPRKVTDEIIETLPSSNNPVAANEPDDDDSGPREIDHNQETETPNLAAQILYRYLVKDESGEILEKEESSEPIEVKLDDKATGLTDQTVLEVITTKNVYTKLEHVSASRSLHTVLKIHSTHLINALRQVISYYPQLNLSGVPVTITEPFRPLVHYMKELEGYKSSHPKLHDDDFIHTTNSHIDILLGFLDQRLGQSLRLERERHQRQPPVATFEYLWLLFRPGDQIFVRAADDEEGHQPYVFAMMHPRHRSSYDGYQFLVWNIDISRAGLAPFEGERSVQPFEGEKEISSLAVCPSKFFPNRSRVEEQYISRGMKVVRLFEPSYMEYVGTTKGNPSIEINGKIMVDSQSWLLHSGRAEHLFSSKKIYSKFYGEYDYDDTLGEGCECRACEGIVDKPSQFLPIRDFIWGGERHIGSITLNDQFYLLCRPVVRGYALNERNWVEFNIDQISEPKIDPDPFSNLVLESEIKDTIEALVCNYAQTDSKVESWGKDFVRDKGEGRIFLLHGSPGVGKTCTAECVADLIRRPLLPLTCGDMGIIASEVEKNFNLFFELGERWGAVVLMDEADVYLEQRTSENLERNSLVSVFLRSLEYFRGVLFLTTNRVGSFDDAFISRIHVALHYKRLSDDYRSKIWEKNFNRLAKEGSITIAPGAIMYIISDADARAVEWNGREIRNAFQTAVALAQYQARKDGKKQVVLEADHLKRVVKMSRLFKEYITSTHKNQDEAKRAIINEQRDDGFGSSQLN